MKQNTSTHQMSESKSIIKKDPFLFSSLLVFSLSGFVAISILLLATYNPSVDANSITLKELISIQPNNALQIAIYLTIFSFWVSLTRMLYSTRT